MNVMSYQIKPTRILPERITRTNPYSGLPSDLESLRRGTPKDVPLDEFASSEEAGVDSVDVDTGTATAGSVETLGAAIVEPTPTTPAIIGVKEQVVGFNPDGTTKIDLVLEVEDVEGAVEYDIRVAKGEGNL